MKTPKTDLAAALLASVLCLLAGLAGTYSSATLTSSATNVGTLSAPPDGL